MMRRALRLLQTRGWRIGWAVVLVLMACGAQAAAEDDLQQLLRHSNLPKSIQVPEGKPLSPATLDAVWRGLVDSPVAPSNFAPRTVLAALVREALATGEPMAYAQLRARAQRFRSLVVVSPDGYVRTALTGKAFARMGVLHLEQGELYVQRLRVGAFYFDEGHVFYAVDGALQRQGPPLGECPLGRDAVTAFGLGAEQARQDMARGMAALFTHPMLTLRDLAQLPVAVGGLIAHSPEYLAHYVDLPWEEQVKQAGRLTTHLLMLRGGAELAGPRLASGLRTTVLEVSGQGTLVAHEVMVPAGAMTVMVGAGAGAVSLVLMSGGNGSAQAPPTTQGWTPPGGGPGQWERKLESMQPEAQRYQSQVTGAPEGWVYRIRTGPGPRDVVDFDGFKEGVLLEVKGPGYQKLFRKMNGKKWFEGLDDMLAQAKKQNTAVKDVSVQWHFAEQEVADLIRRLFLQENLDNIQVIHTAVIP